MFQLTTSKRLSAPHGQSLTTVLILTIVFSRVAKLDSYVGVWYPLFVLATILPLAVFRGFPQRIVK
jgi:hypothetical protein